MVAIMLMAAVTTYAQNSDPQMRHSTRIEKITPNPYDPSTGNAQIVLVLTAAADAELTIYALDGSLVARLLRERLEQGVRTVDWDGRAEDGARVASGVYVCRLQIGKVVRSASLVVAR